MSHTTEQTAYALKAAGFPQGTPIGYGLSGDCYIFCPTAEDILAALGEGWSLSPVKTEGKTFWSVTFMEDGFVQNHEWHEIAAEACAAAYLNLYAPK